MRVPYYEYEIGPDSKPKYTNHFGKGIVNDIVYITQPFRDYMFLGVALDESDTGLGVTVFDGVSKYRLTGVSVKHNCTEQQSDDIPEKEQEQIEKGLTTILFFRGCDNTSFMRRMTRKTFDSIKTLTRYHHEPADLYFNS